MEDFPEEPENTEEFSQDESWPEESTTSNPPQEQSENESPNDDSVKPSSHKKRPTRSSKSRGIFGSRSPIEIIIVILILKHLFRGRKLFG